MKLGVQTKGLIKDDLPFDGFDEIKNAGFSSVDFSLNGYLTNAQLYQHQKNTFFDQSIQELEAYFSKIKEGAKRSGVTIHQMHMPYPLYVPGDHTQLNQYLWDVVAPKSLAICKFLECKYIVVHGFKLTRFLGSEEASWKETEKFLDTLAPIAKELQIVICIENLYESMGGHFVEGPCNDATLAASRIDCLNERHQGEIFGFCFDTGHANLLGINLEQFVLELGSRLKVLHIHDNDGALDLHQLPFTFTKTRENRASTDWQGLMRGLSAIQFNGVLSFETAPVLNAFPKELKKEVLSFIAAIGHYFSDTIEKTSSGTYVEEN